MFIGGGEGDMSGTVTAGTALCVSRCLCECVAPFLGAYLCPLSVSVGGYEAARSVNTADQHTMCTQPQMPVQSCLLLISFANSEIF